MTTSTPVGTQPAGLYRGFILAVAAWCGLLGGLGETAVYAVRKFGMGQMLRESRDLYWLVPTANLLFGLAIGILVWLAARVLSRRQLWPVALAAGGFVAVLAVLFTFPRFHRGAAMVLAAGIALQAARLAARHPTGFRRLVTRTLVPMLVVWLGLFGIIRGRQFLGERRALSSMPQAEEGAPNVLLIILDTVRALNLSLYGYHRPTTPNLDRWASGGVRFDQAISTSPWTLPSHASIFTGRLPHELSTDWFLPLDRTWPTLAEAMAARGYHTAGFVANLGYTSWETGLNRGFSHYEDFPLTPDQLISSASVGRRLMRTRVFRRLFRPDDEGHGRKYADELNREFLGWLDGRGTGGRPFFTFLNYYDAHEPYVAPAPFDRRFVEPGQRLEPFLNRKKTPDFTWKPDVIQAGMNAYDGSLAYLDSELGKLFTELETRGLLKNTLVILTADHGEEFNEHGMVHHGNSLYRPSVHVPLVLWWPAHLPAGRGVPTPVSLRDLPATVMDLLGAAPTFPGRPLTRFLGPNPDVLAPDTLVAELQFAPRQVAWYPSSKGNLTSALYGGLRYIRNGDGREELFEFADQDEQRNLASAPERAGDLEHFRQIMKSIGTTWFDSGPVSQAPQGGQ